MKNLSFILVGQTSLLVKCVEHLIKSNYNIICAISSDKVTIEELKKKDIIIANLQDLTKYKADYILSIVNPYVIPEHIIKKVAKLGINYHDALLPQYAGRNAASWALYNQEKKHGITWHAMNDIIDAGDILLQRSFPIENDDNSTTLSIKCHNLALKSLASLCGLLTKKTFRKKSQDFTKRSYYSINDKPQSKGIIHLNHCANDIRKEIAPFIFLNSRNTFTLAKIIIGTKPFSFNRISVTNTKSQYKPGTIISLEGNKIECATKDLNVILHDLCPLYPSNNIDITVGEIISDDSNKVEIAVGIDEHYWSKLVEFTNFVFPPQFLEKNWRKVNYSKKSFSYLLEKHYPLEIIILAACMYLGKVTDEDKVSILVFCNKNILFPFTFTEETLESLDNSIRKINRIISHKSGINYDFIYRYQLIDFKKSHQVVVITDGTTDAIDSDLTIGYNSEQKKLTVSVKFLNNDIKFFIDALKEYIVLYSDLLLSSDKLDSSWSQYITKIERDLYFKHNHNASYDSLELNAKYIGGKIQSDIIDDNAYLHNDYANKLIAFYAKRIFELVGTANYIGVIGDNSSLYIVSILSCLRSGNIFVPISTDLPKNRTTTLIKNSLTKLLLYQNENDISGLKTQYRIKIVTDVPQASLKNFFITNAQNALAYVLYTSGSTGLPKGVACFLHSIINLIDSFQRQAPLTKNDYCLLHTTISFDVHIYEIFSALYSGANIVIFPKEKPKTAENLFTFCLEKKITSLYLPPHLINDFVILARKSTEKPKIKRFLIGVEPIKYQLIEELNSLFPLASIINGYGPTEATVCCTSYVFKKDCLYPVIPIGSVIPGNTGLVVGRANHPVSIGSVGELVINGANVSAGYQVNSRIQPFDAANKAQYKTGDLVKMMPSGVMLFVGRVDEQIKMNGVRVDLAELRNILLSFPAVSFCYFKINPEKKLMAFCQVEDKRITEKDIISYMAEWLPYYMLPQEVIIKEIPHNHNDKVDVNKLTSSVKESSSCLKNNYPSDIITTCLAKALALSHINKSDDFFKLGGTSLKAMHFIDLLLHYGYKISIIDIYKFRTVERICGAVKTIKNDNKYLLKNEIFSLSSFQKEIIFTEKILHSPVYNIPIAFIISKEVDLTKLEYALTFVFNELTSLRIKISDNRHFYIAKKGKVQIDKVVTSDKLEEALFRLSNEPLLEKNALLYKLAIIKRKNDTVLFINIHHIITDGWAIKIMLDCISHVYNKDDIHALRHYRYQSPLDSSLTQIRKDFWINYLSGREVTKIENHCNQKLNQTFSYEIPKKYIEKCILLSKKINSTLEKTFIGLLMISLRDFLNVDNLLIGMLINERLMQDESESLGAQICSLPFCCNFKKEILSDYIKSLSNNLLEIYENKLSLSSISKIIKQQSRLFDILLNINLHDYSKSLSLNNCSVRQVYVPCISGKCPLLIGIQIINDHYLLYFESYSGYISDRQATDIFKAFNHAIDFYDDPNQILYDKETLPKDIRMNNKLKYKTIVEWFSAIAEKYPNNRAVTYQDNSITYNELINKSKEIARFLCEDKICPGENVGLFFDRSIDMIAAVIAVLFCECAYVPLEPRNPLSRNNYIILNASIKYILTNKDTVENHAEFYENHKKELLFIDDIPFNTASGKISNGKEDDLAYIIYTSGTTGDPKGIAITHENVMHLFDNAHQLFDLTPKDKWTLFHSYSFDFSVWEYFGALLTGAELVIVGEDIVRDMDKFSSLIINLGITILSQTPTLFSMLSSFVNDTKLEMMKNNLRYIVFAGENLQTYHIKNWANKTKLNKTKLVNMYGLTESTIHATCHFIQHEDLNFESIPIQPPLPHFEILLLDEDRKSVATNQEGEIYLSGLSLCKGYYRLPELTKKKFITINNKKYYATGDLAKYCELGNLFYLRRKDTQVKVRGYRIELSAIESVLCLHDNIKNAVVVVKEIQNNKFILAFIIVNDSEKFSTNEIKAFLSSKLPFYSIPHHFIVLEKIPTTISGKVDKKSLLSSYELHMPENVNGDDVSINDKIFEALRKNLKKPNINLNDDYFELGGDSLLCLELIDDLEKQGINLSVAEIYQKSRISELILHLSNKSHAQTKETLVNQYKGYEEDIAKFGPNIEDVYPITRLQLGMIYHSILQPESSIYKDIFCYLIASHFSREIFEECLQACYERHPILRTTFHVHGYSQPLQVIHKEVNTQLTIVDYTEAGLQNVEQIMNNWISVQKLQEINLQNLPLVKFSIIMLSSDHFCLGMVTHHALLDGWSAANLIAELLLRYNSQLHRVPYQPNDFYPFKHYALSEYSLMSSSNLKKFWRRYMKNARKTILMPQSTSAKVDINQIDYFIDGKTLLYIQNKVESLSTSIDAVLFYLHALSIANLTQSSQVTLAFVSNVRPEKEASVNTLGLFLNILQMNYVFNEGMMIDEFARFYQHKSKLTKHRFLPFSEVNNILKTQYFDCIFNFVNFRVIQEIPDQVKIKNFMGYERTNFPFVVGCERLYDGTIKMTLKYLLCAESEKVAVNYIREFKYHINQFINDKPLIFGFNRNNNISAILSHHSETSNVNSQNHYKAYTYQLKKIWQKYLPQKSFSYDEDFYACGGDSILALQIVLAMQQEGLSITIEQFLQNPTLNKLSQLLSKHVDTEQLPSLVEQKLHFPLSETQHIILKNYRRDNSYSYHTQYVCKLSVNNISEFTNSVIDIVGKCLNFRLKFLLLDDQYYQFIDTESELPILLHNTNAIKPIMQKRLEAAFDIVSGVPWILDIITASENSVVLIFTLHHIIIDGWSFSKILNKILNKENVDFISVEENEADLRRQSGQMSKRWENEVQHDYWKNYCKKITSNNPIRLPPSRISRYYEVDVALSAVIRKISLQWGASEKSVIFILAARAIAHVLRVEAINFAVITNGRGLHLQHPLESLGLFWTFKPVQIRAQEDTTKLLDFLKSHFQICDLYGTYPFFKLFFNHDIPSYFHASYNYTNFHELRHSSITTNDIKMIECTTFDPMYFPINFSYSAALSFIPAQIIIQGSTRQQVDNIYHAFVKECQRGIGETRHLTLAIPE